jgi:hypothetical protein
MHTCGARWQDGEPEPAAYPFRRVNAPSWRRQRPPAFSIQAHNAHPRPVAPSLFLVAVASGWQHVAELAERFVARSARPTDDPILADRSWCTEGRFSQGFHALDTMGTHPARIPCQPRLSYRLGPLASRSERRQANSHLSGDGNGDAARGAPCRSVLPRSDRSGISPEIHRQRLIGRPFTGAQIPVASHHPLQRRPRRVITHRACVSRWPASSPSYRNRSQGPNRSPSQGRFHAILTVAKDIDCPRSKKIKK